MQKNLLISWLCSCKGTIPMKAVLHYRATPGFRAAISALENDWLRIAVVDETDKQAFAREMQDADVLLHVLERVTAAMIEQAPRLKLDSEARRRRRHDRPRGGARARHRRVQHAGSQYARRCGAHVAADAGDAPAAVRARQPDTRGKRDGRSIPSSSTTSASSAAAQSGSSDSAPWGSVSRRCCRASAHGHLHVAHRQPTARPRRFVSLPALLSDADVVSLHVPLTQQTTA